MMFGKNNGSAETAKRIPRGSEGVEIGVWRGDSTALFLNRAAHIHLVDPWAVTAYHESDEFGDYAAYLSRYSRLVGSRKPEDFQTYYDRVHAAVASRFDSKSVTIHRKTSREFFASFNGMVDWVYVDGLHSFTGCLEDLESSLRIARHRIFGDDYGNKPGVTRAVDALVSKYDLKLDVFGGNQYEIWN